MSAPQGSSTSSINSLIPHDQFSLQYIIISDAINSIKLAGRGSWLAKADISDAFKVMPIHPSLRHLFGICWEGKFYFATQLTFGCRSSPKIFDTLSEALCWILLNVYHVPFLLHLLDDFLVISPPSSTALLEIYPIVAAAQLWGHLWSKKSILFYCDNSTTVHIINKGRTSSALIMQLLRRLVWISVSNNFLIQACHLPGIFNNAADALSRLQISKFHSLLPSALQYPAATPQFNQLIFN